MAKTNHHSQFSSLHYESSPKVSQQLNNEDGVKRAVLYVEAGFLNFQVCSWSYILVLILTPLTSTPVSVQSTASVRLLHDNLLERLDVV